jgi:hypothetical protein
MNFRRFWVKKNLTEINHKVSVTARGFFLKKGRFMQEALIGEWARESHLSAEHLVSVRDLNCRFLDLACRGVLSQPLALQLAPLTAPQRAAAANCPYALFDLRFEDDAHWRARLTSMPLCIADEPRIDAATVDFVRLALFYTWHIASSPGLMPQLVLGMHGGTADGFRRISVDSLPALALAEASNLAPRWHNSPAYWRALTRAAARSDPRALRRVQLSGLQLAVAGQLPSEPREV